MLTEKETIKKMESLGFEQSTFDTWEADSKKFKYADCVQFAPYKRNFDNSLDRFNVIQIKKFYIVKLARGFQVRVWGVYS